MKKAPKKFQKKKIQQESHTEVSSQKSPRIYRKIPEFLIYFISGSIIMAIVILGFSLNSHITELEHLRSTKEQVEREYSYWQMIVKKYDSYRDGYFRLATIAYRLGKISEAKEYTTKALLIDPLFQPAQTFQEKIKK